MLVLIVSFEKLLSSRERVVVNELMRILQPRERG
nr:MAG TPA: hypothetical protein [Caudoviricetes sp.]